MTADVDPGGFVPGGAVHAFDAETAAHVEFVAEHLNANHADTVLLVARHIDPLVADAEIVAIEPSGASFALRRADGAGANRRLEFSEPARTADDVQMHLFAALALARSAVGDSVPLTSLEAEVASAVELTTTHGYVVGRRHLTPNLIEVTLGGFHGYPLRGGDEFVYAMVSHEPGGIHPGYGMTEYQAQEPGGPVRGAYYTVRRSRPDTGEIDLWVVAHHAPGSVADWMQRAAPGEPIALWGPRHGFVPEPGARRIVLVADETGFAAVAALLESLDPDVTVTAVLETVDAKHRPDLPDHAGATFVWVERRQDTAGLVNRLLPTTAALLNTGSDAAPDAAFGAAESRQISAVRRHLRTAIGLPAASMLMTGYWRRA